MTPTLFIVPLLLSSLSLSHAQSIAPSPAADACNGIFLSYAYTSGVQLPPTLKSNPTRQPYRFESTVTIINNGLDPLKSWKVWVGFTHEEYLVSASNAILADGTSLPAAVETGTVFAGYPSTDLETAIETAGDLTQMSTRIDLVGTQFGVGSPNIPMPVNISLANDGFVCPNPTLQGKTEMQVCCIKDSNFKTNITSDDGFLPLQNGDLTIMYDVIRTYDSSYWAQVTIANHNPLGRLDNWKLSWDWMREEFIYTMKGAYPDVLDASDCIYGDQGKFYKELDFANVLNCQRRPTLVDLPLERTNDTTLGMIPFCCRNGTILPPSMDPSKSTSVFQINVFKMPPDLNRSQLTPPQNWKINGTLNPDYQCGPPIRVSPSQFPDPSGLPSDRTAFASWQVVCNITQPKGASPRCCVSFSAYYNESVIPCKTCACGCHSTSSQTCSTTSPALLLPPQAILVPFENRTDLANAWADLKHFPKPNPLPCGDNCGVSINWHLYTDYSRGWTARITIFNWDDTSFADWFTAVEMDKAAPGFEKVYSFNGSSLSGANNTIFMQGLADFNYLVAETDGANPEKDPRVPGKQQSVISFTKKNTPGINVVGGDGFPTKVFFNGEECSLPTALPTNNAYRKGSTISISILLAIVVFMLMHR
ncbi:LOW QUALITY PROTEIN: COBRA-like protein 7 [Actinidia eriantha]|uniref:LOW QUALITY PROTEIN: COBRA-like protein 7 n=1 Tax=Actinidia eriantha TaxID=165200 RepID=UPI00258AA292|nr:LOW QUALITY PROTEIN: COBRA-like protein 7 [Actinidia eriantha]